MRLGFFVFFWSMLPIVGYQKIINYLPLIIDIDKLFVLTGKASIQVFPLLRLWHR